MKPIISILSDVLSDYLYSGLMAVFIAQSLYFIVLIVGLSWLSGELEHNKVANNSKQEKVLRVLVALCMLYFQFRLTQVIKL